MCCRSVCYSNGREPVRDEFTPINRLLGGYKEQPLDLSRADGANITYNDDGTITLGEGYSEIEFTGIDARYSDIDSTAIV